MPVWASLKKLFTASKEDESVSESLVGEAITPPSTRIVIWDLENCAVPSKYCKDIPKLVKALKANVQTCRVVTAVAAPTTQPSAADQLRALSECDVEVLSFPRQRSGSAKKYNSSDYVLKRVKHETTIFGLEFCSVGLCSLCCAYQSNQSYSY